MVKCRHVLLTLNLLELIISLYLWNTICIIDAKFIHFHLWRDVYFMSIANSFFFTCGKIFTLWEAQFKLEQMSPWLFSKLDQLYVQEWISMWFSLKKKSFNEYLEILNSTITKFSQQGLCWVTESSWLEMKTKTKPNYS